MDKILAAWQIFMKYGNTDYPISAEHDEIHIHYNPAEMNPLDILELNELGFHPADDHFYHFT